MDLLKTIAFPQPTEHYHLLLLVMAFAYVISVPYLGLVLGSSLLSLRLRRRWQESKENRVLRFSADLMDVALKDRKLPHFLGVFPSAALVFVYAQLFQRTDAIVVSVMTIGFLLISAGLYFLSSYRDAHRWLRFLEAYREGAKGSPDATMAPLVDSSVERQAAVLTSGGRNGIVLLAAGMFLAMGATAVASDRSAWDLVGGLFELLLSGAAWVKFLAFIAISGAVTGIGVLFFFFVWEGGLPGMDAQYSELVRTTCLKVGGISLLALPLLLLLSAWLLPAASESGVFFAFLGIGVLLLFVAGTFVYAYAREDRRAYLSYAAYTLALGTVLLMVNDHVAVGMATREHAVLLAALHEVDTEALKTRLGVGKPAATGEDIYNGRCSACHMFDEKKVGPPYRTVIPKYAGKKDALVAFVLNPRKIDASYPPMPNQGLKPVEADSIASYLLRKYGAPAVQEAGK
jgi:cytochrome c551/c552